MKTRWTLLATAALGLTLAAGPRARVSERFEEPAVGPDVERYLADVESGVPGLPEAERKSVVWADSAARAPTPLAMVYLHGFSADRHEIDPVPLEVARRLGANLLYTRLTGHALPGDALGEARAEDWFGDVAEAIAVADRLGRRTVLLGTSTGGTLAVWAATREEWREELAALVLVSPNFHPRDRTSRMLLWPWGGALARAVVGPERCFEPENREQEEHWTVCYPTRALLPMMALVEYVRTGPLERVRAPVLALYSPHDRVVDPVETQWVVPRMGGTPKRMVQVLGAEDPADHLLAGSIMSPGTTALVIREIVDFLAPIADAAAGGGSGGGLGGGAGVGPGGAAGGARGGAGGP